jgi:hypothetical protein
MRIRRVVTVLALGVLVPAWAEAQSAQAWSLQLSGTGNVIFSESNRSFIADNGLGGEAQIRFTPGAFSVGLGAQFARHASEATSAESVLRVRDEDLELGGLFLEPRLVVAAGGAAAVYLSGRFALSSITVAENVGRVLCNTDTDGVDPRDVTECTELGTVAEGQATGFTVNGGGGIVFRLSDRVNLDLGATVGIKDFGEAEFSATTTGIDGSDDRIVRGDLGSFGNAVVRLGLAIGLGG